MDNLTKPNTPAQDRATIEAKIDELILLLKFARLEKDEIKALQRKVTLALSEDLSAAERLKEFRQLDDDEMDREDMISNLETLLNKHPIDSDIAKKYLINERIKKLSVLAIGLIMLSLGLYMIVMPAPPYFEMFTIFYFDYRYSD